VTGLTGLVPLAELLAEISGSRRAAVDLAADVLTDGDRALRQRQSDVTSAAVAELHATSVVREGGRPEPSRAAELLVVCEVLACAAQADPPDPPEQRLVFSAPSGSVPIPAHERLDGLVLDVIRLATTELAIAGAFWNAAGFQMLHDVLHPAITARGVRATIYVNRADQQFLLQLEASLAELQAEGAVTVRWFVGPAPTMLHAKMVVRDRSHGYLGTANLTSWGMREHIEAGVELGPKQSSRMVAFMEDLDAAGLFADKLPNQHAETGPDHGATYGGWPVTSAEQSE
jgi:hypothetical protein